MHVERRSWNANVAMTAHLAGRPVIGQTARRGSATDQSQDQILILLSVLMVMFEGR